MDEININTHIKVQYSYYTLIVDNLIIRILSCFTVGNSVRWFELY